MAGLYVHIPFCKRRCNYCDFFSTTLLAKRKAYVDALIQEIQARKQEVQDPIRTIYIGGGTPSTLTAADIQHILDAIGIQDATEITMEINPADADYRYLRRLRKIGVNRLSIGIQSFQEKLLKRLGRRHDGIQAGKAIREAQLAGFDHISIDLMYAIPTQTWQDWYADVDVALAYKVQHISAYGLIYEEGTVLTQQVQAGELQAIDEDTENEMYDYLCKRMRKAGFVHYEVSNFALPRHRSRHNSSYWNNTPYIGVGAGAHSYIGNVRSWNPDDLHAYIKGIRRGTLQRESEILTDNDLYNERIMLGLRTSKGIDPAITRQIPGKEKIILDYTQQGMLRETKTHRIVATQKGLHLLNRIIEDLMI